MMRWLMLLLRMRAPAVESRVSERVLGIGAGIVLLALAAWMIADDLPRSQAAPVVVDDSPLAVPSDVE